MLLRPSPAADQSAVLQAAIHDTSLPEVHLGPGLWRSGPLTLRSGLTLRLAPGAVLQALPEPERYPHHRHAVASRMDVFPRRAFLFGDGLEDVTLCGEGRIDFSGDHPAFADGVPESPDRPFGLLLVGCRRLRLEGLNLRNSAFWMARLLQCRDVRIRDLDIFNHANLNNDGLDLDSCEDVLVSGCTVDTSDDGIVIKSETSAPSRRIIVSDCLVSSHASAIKLGTGSVGGFHQILVHHCVVRPSRATVMHHPFAYWRGMTGLDVAAVDGGHATDIQFDHIALEGVANPIFVRLGARRSAQVVPLNRRTEDARPGPPTRPHGAMERLSFTGITGTDVGPLPCVFAGHKGYDIRDLTLRDISLQLSAPTNVDPAVEPDWNPRAYPCARLVAGTNGGMGAHGAVFRHIAGLTLENVRFAAAGDDPRPAVLRHDCR